MKYLQTGSLILLSCFCYLSSFGQKVPVNEPDYNKPKLFHDLPAKIAIERNVLLSVFQAKEGETIQLDIGGNTQLTGQLTSSVNKYNNTIQSAVIKLTNRAGSHLTLVRTIMDDGSERLSGRIVSMQHGDGFVLVLENEKYYLVKKDFNDMISE